MNKNSNETSFSLFKYSIEEDVDAYVHLIKYIKNCGEFPKKLVNPSGCDAAIELSKNNGASNQMD